MNKSFILLTLCCILVLAAITSAKVTISFKDSNQVFVKDLPSVVQINIDNIRFASSRGVNFSFEPTQAELDAHDGDANWDWQPLETALGLHPKDLHVIGYEDGAKNLCVETTTGKPIGFLNYLSSTRFNLRLNDEAGQFGLRYNQDDGFGTWNFECLIVFTQTTNAFNTFNVKATYEVLNSSGDFEEKIDDLTLQPARPYFVVPVVDFRSLSVSQNQEDFFSSSAVDFSFSTNSTGHFFVSVANGPVFLAYPTKSDEKPDFWCTAGDNKYRMVYSYDDEQVYIFVDVPTDSTINCSAFVSQSANNAKQADVSVSTQRIVFTITHSDVAVKRTADWTFYPANVQVIAGQLDVFAKDMLAVIVKINNLFHSSTPLRVNSTVSFQFSDDVNVSTFLPAESSSPSSAEGYRSFQCFSSFTTGNAISGTLSVDADSNTITISDIIDTSGLYSGMICIFGFGAGQGYNYEKDATFTIVTKIDGNSAISVESNTEKAIVHFSRDIQKLVGSGSPLPAWIPFSVLTKSADCQAVGEDKLELTYRFDLNDDYTTFGWSPVNPVLIFSFTDPEYYHFSQDELKDQLRCEATSATHSLFEPIELTFEKDLMAWTYKVAQVDDVEAYAIKFRCYRTETIHKQFGLIMNQLTNLSVQYIDLENGNRYYEQPVELNMVHSSDCYAKFSQKDPSSSSYPPTAETRFCVNAKVALPSFDDAGFKAVVDQFKSSFEAAVTAVDATKSISLTPWLARRSTLPLLADTNKVAFEQAEQWYDYYHTTIGHDQVLQYRVYTGAPALPFFSLIPFPYFPSIEFPSPDFNSVILKSTSVVQLCYVVSSADYTLLNNNIDAVQEELWHKQLPITPANAYIPTDALVELDSSILASPVSGCGILDGLSIAPNDGTGYTWDDGNGYPISYRYWKLCLLGETCQMNADCDQSSSLGPGFALATAVCKSADGQSAKTCQYVARKQSPYIRFNSGTSVEDKSQYAFNSAASASVVFAAVVALIALLF